MSFLYLLKISILFFLLFLLLSKRLRIFFLELNRFFFLDLKNDKENKLFVIYLFSFFLFLFLFLFFIYVITTVYDDTLLENDCLRSPRLFFFRNNYIYDVIDYILNATNPFINYKEDFLPLANHEKVNIKNMIFYYKISSFDYFCLEYKRMNYLLNSPIVNIDVDHLRNLYYDYDQEIKKDFKNLRFLTFIKCHMMYMITYIMHTYNMLITFIIPYIIKPFINLYLYIFIYKNINIFIFLKFSIIYFIIIFYFLIKNYNFLLKNKIFYIKKSIISTLLTYLYIFIFFSGLYNLLFFNLFGFFFSFNEYLFIKDISTGLLNYIYQKFGNDLLIVPLIIYILFFPLIKKLYLHLILDTDKYTEVLSFTNNNSPYVRRLYDSYNFFFKKDIIILFYFNYILILYSLDFIYTGILDVYFYYYELIPFFYFFHVSIIIYYIYNIIFRILYYYKKKINLHHGNKILENKNEIYNVKKLNEDKDINKIYEYLEKEKRIQEIQAKHILYKNNENKNNENKNNENKNNENKNNENKNINDISNIYNYIYLFFKEVYSIIKVLFIQIIRIFDSLYILKEIKNEYDNKNNYKIRFHFIFSIFSIILFIFLFIYSFFIRLILENISFIIINLFSIFYFLIMGIFHLFLFIFNYIYRTFLYFYRIYVIHFSKYNDTFFLYIYKYLLVIKIFYSELKPLIEKLISEIRISIQLKKNKKYNEYTKYINVAKKNLKHKRRKEYKLIFNVLLTKFKFFLKKILSITISIKNFLIFIVTKLITIVYHFIKDLIVFMIPRSKIIFYCFNYMFFIISFECIIEHYILIFLDNIINDGIPNFINYHVNIFDKFNFIFDIIIKDFSKKESSKIYETNFFYILDMYLNLQKNFFLFTYDVISNSLNYIYESRIKVYTIGKALSDNRHDYTIKSFFDYTGYMGRFEAHKSTTRANRLYVRYLLLIIILLLIIYLKVSRFNMPVEDYTFPYILEYISNFLKNKKKKLIYNILKNKNNDFKNYSKEVFKKVAIYIFDDIINFFKKKKDVYIFFFPIYHIHFELVRLILDFLYDFLKYFLKNILDFFSQALKPFLIYLYKERIKPFLIYLYKERIKPLLIYLNKKRIKAKRIFHLENKSEFKKKNKILLKIKKSYFIQKTFFIINQLFKIIKLIIIKLIKLIIKFIIIPLKYLLMINTLIYYTRRAIIRTYNELKELLIILFLPIKVILAPVIFIFKCILRFILRFFKVLILLIKLIKLIIKLIYKIIHISIKKFIKINKSIEILIEKCKRFIVFFFFLNIYNKIQEIFMVILYFFFILFFIKNLYLHLIEYRIINEMYLTLVGEDYNMIMTRKSSKILVPFYDSSNLLYKWMNIDNYSHLNLRDYLSTTYYYYMNLLNIDMYLDTIENIYQKYCEFIKHLKNLIQYEMYFNYLNGMYFNNLKNKINDIFLYINNKYLFMEIRNKKDITLEFTNIVGINIKDINIKDIDTEEINIEDKISEELQIKIRNINILFFILVINYILSYSFDVIYELFYIIISFIKDSFIVSYSKIFPILNNYFDYISNKLICFTKNIYTIFHDFKDNLQFSIYNFFKKYIIDTIIDANAIINITNRIQSFYGQLNDYTIKVILFQKEIDLNTDNLYNNILLVFTISFLVFILLLIIFNLKSLIKFCLLGILFFFFYLLNILYFIILNIIKFFKFKNLLNRATKIKYIILKKLLFIFFNNNKLRNQRKLIFFKIRKKLVLEKINMKKTSKKMLNLLFHNILLFNKNIINNIKKVCFYFLRSIFKYFINMIIKVIRNFYEDKKKKLLHNFFKIVTMIRNIYIATEVNPDDWEKLNQREPLDFQERMLFKLKKFLKIFFKKISLFLERTFPWRRDKDIEYTLYEKYKFLSIKLKRKWKKKFPEKEKKKITFNEKLKTFVINLGLKIRIGCIFLKDQKIHLKLFNLIIKLLFKLKEIFNYIIKKIYTSKEYILLRRILKLILKHYKLKICNKYNQIIKYIECIYDKIKKLIKKLFKIK